MIEYLERPELLDAAWVEPWTAAGRRGAPGRTHARPEGVLELRNCPFHRLPRSTSRWSAA